MNLREQEKVTVVIPIQFMSSELTMDDSGNTRSSVNADFQLQVVTPPTTAKTRAISQFGNTWVIAFAADGACVACTNAGSISPDIPLSLELPVEVNMTLYVLANGPSVLARPANLTEFESNTYFSSKTYIDENTLPYIGKTTGISIDSQGRIYNSGNANIQIQLKRICAKLSITCDISVADYRIASVRLHNAPPKMYYTYSNTTGEISTDSLEASIKAGNTYIWFIGENLRSNGSSTNQYERYTAKAPASSTFIRVVLESTVGPETVAYDIYPGKNLTNNYDLARNWDYIYTTTFTKSGAELTKDKRVTTTDVPIDLTNVPSNCFVMAPGKSYKFNPCIKGEGQSETGGVNIPINHTVDEIRLAWQDTQSLVRSIGLSSSHTSSVVSINPGKEGNAMVVAYASGTPVWSWHLWVRSKGIQWYSTNGLSSMSCNLGGLNFINDDNSGPNSLGLLYQWGRHIPFPGAIDIRTNAIRPVYDINNNIVKFTTRKGAVSVSETIANPTVFFYTNATGVSWHQDGDDLWGGTSKVKTIFDPSPRGWRVPADNTVWSDWTATTFRWDDANPSRTQYDPKDKRGLFPAAGFYTNNPGSGQPEIINVSDAARYWSSIFTNGEGGVLYFTSTVVERATVDQSYGCSLRPVKQ